MSEKKIKYLLLIMDNRYYYDTGIIIKNSSYSKSSSNFSYKDSAIKGIKSGGLDKVGEVVSGGIIKEKRVWKSLGTLTLGKYRSNLSRGAKFSKKALGLVGTIGFAIWDIKGSIADGKYMGAGIDAVSALIGVGAGALIGVSGAGPALLFIGGIGLGC